MQKSKKFLSTIPAKGWSASGGSYQLSAISGFTLIELLVVISIFGLLAALILANFNAARERARDVQRKSDLDNIKKALRMYYNNDSQYPDHSGGDDIKACGSGASASPCTPWNGETGWERSGMTYMKVLPQDPSYDLARYKYQMNDSGSQDFCLWATLENASDADIAQTQNRCSDCSVGASDYVVCAD